MPWKTMHVREQRVRFLRWRRCAASGGGSIPPHNRVNPLSEINPLTHTFQRSKSRVRLAGHFPETAKLEVERKKPAENWRAFVLLGGKPSQSARR